MSHYSEWNQAIHRYFLETNVSGASAFLSVDDESLRVAARRMETNAAGPVEDFCRAVRERCVIRGRVRLHMVRGREKSCTASGAFLALLVLAATRMNDDETTSATAYFARLRQLLGFAPAQVGEAVRPPGLDAGDEVPLWEEWNRWVQERGFVPSARQGYGLQDRYRGYAIGQSLLRDVDKGALHKTFVRHRFGTLLDGDEVLRLTRRASHGLTVHLRDLLHDERGDAAADRIFEVYEEWSQARHRQSREAGEKSNVMQGQPVRAFAPVGKTLFCGVLRREHPFTGEVSYHLLPRLRPHHEAREGQLLLGDSWLPLRPLDELWWHDVGPLKEETLVAGQLFPIRGENSENHVYAGALLPARGCWVLVPDTRWGSEDFASWREPRLGEEFVLLARRALFEQLEPLRGRVLDWSGSPEPLEALPQWAELSGITIVATDWSQIALASDELLEALRPRKRLHLSLAGGIRWPARAGCWMQEHPPTLQIHAIPTADALAQISLFAPGEDKPRRIERFVNVAYPLDLNEPGVWRIEVEHGGYRAVAVVELVAWQGARMAPPSPEPVSLWGDWSWRGAHLQNRSALSDGVRA